LPLASFEDERDCNLVGGFCKGNFEDKAEILHSMEANVAD